MHIQTVAITNYKSFWKEQRLQFEPGFNLLVGTNNAGKTSVLDVIDMDVSLNDPHRSEGTIPNIGSEQLDPSQGEVLISVSYSELRSAVGNAQVFLPLQRVPLPNKTDDETNAEVAHFICSDGTLQIRSVFGGGNELLSIEGGGFVAGTRNRQNTNGEAMPAALVQHIPGKEKFQISLGNFAGNGASVINYGQSLRSRIYRFHAQRRPGFQGPQQSSAILDREATTLPFCINHLQTNDAHGHKTLCEWINRVFPSVKWVQAPPSGGEFAIRCLPHEPEKRRDDLSIPLSRMGAGIGNVIAMLYVVLTARNSQVIAIDEPNAFLHPRALRELLAILESEGRKHQFILTAHSADVLTAVSARSIALLEFDGIATTVRQVGSKDLRELRGALADLGIRMTDLHAKDHVLWVEGQTEELVVPELLRWACSEIAAGTSVLRVERTGTFSKKSVEPNEVASIYERLSTSSALVPPMVCILLDAETRTSKDRQHLTSLSNSKLRFLERRMLENYLLHPAALAAVISELGCQVEVDDVANRLSSSIGGSGPEQKFIDVDGATVLTKIFSEISGAKLEFRKTRDVPSLVSWLIANDPKVLTPLGDEFRKIFGLAKGMS